MRVASRGEGQLRRHAHVPATEGGQVKRLRLDPSGRDPDPGAAAAAGSAGHRGVRGVPADFGLPAGHRRAQPAGIACSVGLVAHLMRELGLAAVQPRAYKRSTLPGTAPVVAGPAGATSPPPRRGIGWSGTSPTCAPARAGCTWPPSSIWPGFGVERQPKQPVVLILYLKDLAGEHDECVPPVP